RSESGTTATWPWPRTGRPTSSWSHCVRRRGSRRPPGFEALGHHLAVLGHFLFVVLPVEDLPLVGAFDDRALLGLDLSAHQDVDGLVRLHLLGDEAHDVAAHLLGIRKVLDAVVLIEVGQDEVGEAEDLLPGELQRMIPFSRAIFFLSILNISVYVM